MRQEKLKEFEKAWKHTNHYRAKQYCFSFKSSRDFVETSVDKIKTTKKLTLLFD